MTKQKMILLPLEEFEIKIKKLVDEKLNAVFIDEQVVSHEGNGNCIVYQYGVKVKYVPTDVAITLLKERLSNSKDLLERKLYELKDAEARLESNQKHLYQFQKMSVRQFRRWLREVKRKNKYDQKHGS
ncbi:MAG: hypothetical protein PHW73_00195 [Atribacterota bacterium]|nr:hypothetical protein [Atribacterota bacterium]